MLELVVDHFASCVLRGRVGKVEQLDELDEVVIRQLQKQARNHVQKHTTWALHGI